MINYMQVVMLLHLKIIPFERNFFQPHVWVFKQIAVMLSFPLLHHRLLLLLQISFACMQKYLQQNKKHKNNAQNYLIALRCETEIYADCLILKKLVYFHNIMRCQNFYTSCLFVYACKWCFCIIMKNYAFA